MDAIEALTFTLPGEEFRRRVRHALQKDRETLKKLREKNIVEEADVSDIDHKLVLLNGDRDGTPGLIQIFSTQYELLEERTRQGKKDPDQMTMDDAIAQNEADNFSPAMDGVWDDDVPEPRPKAGDRVRSLDDRGILVITEALGFRSRDLTSEGESAGYDAFTAFAVPISKTDGYTENDQLHVWLKPDSTRDESGEWSEIPAPPVNVDAIKEAVKVGESAGDNGERPKSAKTAIESDDEGPSVVKPRRKRTRAAAGNLAGTAKRVVKKAKAGRK